MVLREKVAGWEALYLKKAFNSQRTPRDSSNKLKDPLLTNLHPLYLHLIKKDQEMNL
jgi:hypothetical protein